MDTRRREIVSNPLFDGTKDAIYEFYTPDLSKLKETIEAVTTNSAVQGIYGKTVELFVTGHAGLEDGPIGDQVNPGPGRAGHSAIGPAYQLDMLGWASIDFNWDRGRSVAAFYGCRTFDWAKRFQSFQPDLSRVAGYRGWSAPSVLPNRWVIAQNERFSGGDVYHIGMPDSWLELKRNSFREKYVPFVDGDEFRMSVRRRDGSEYSQWPNVKPTP
jgi:hypothetical protein